MIKLSWQVVSRCNSRRVAYNKKDLIRSLEAEGCKVDKDPNVLMLLNVTRELKAWEDPREVREQVTRAMRAVHPRVPRRFLGMS